MSRLPESIPSPRHLRDIVNLQDNETVVWRLASLLLQDKSATDGLIVSCLKSSVRYEKVTLEGTFTDAPTPTPDHVTIELQGHDGSLSLEMQEGSLQKANIYVHHRGTDTLKELDAPARAERLRETAGALLTVMQSTR